MTEFRRGGRARGDLDLARGGIQEFERTGDFARTQGASTGFERTQAYGHPPIRNAEWESGLMEIFAPLEGSCELCCQAFLCPFGVYKKNRNELVKRESAPTNTKIDSGCRAWCCFSSTTIREFIKEKQGIRSSGDCCAVWFCPCCALIQETTEIHKMYDMDWPWKDRPVKIVQRTPPAPEPIRIPAGPQEVVVKKREQRQVAAPARPPALCPVYIPNDFHSLPEEGLIKAEILPYSSVPNDFKPINADTSAQRPLPPVQQNFQLMSAPEVLPTYEMPILNGGLQLNDRLISQSQLPGPPIGIGLNQMLPQPVPFQAVDQFPVQPAAPLPPLPPMAQNTMGASRTPTKDLNQALYTGGKDYWA